MARRNEVSGSVYCPRRVKKGRNQQGDSHDLSRSLTTNIRIPRFELKSGENIAAASPHF